MPSTAALAPEVMLPPCGWPELRATRLAAEAFGAAAGLASARLEQLAMATHELADNALRHGLDPVVEVGLRRRAGMLELAVSHAASPAAIARLTAHLAAIARGPALDMVLAAMQDGHQEGGLGLARVRLATGQVPVLRVVGARVTVGLSWPLHETEC